jgi:hypothetical protein
MNVDDERRVRVELVGIRENTRRRKTEMKYTTLFVAALLAGSSIAQAQSTTPTTPTTPPAAAETTGTTPATGNSGATSDMMKPGANSFTEAQARERIEKAGFTNVGALIKSADGFWRGEAAKDGAPVRVSVDFKGNVAAM